MVHLGNLPPLPRFKHQLIGGVAFKSYGVRKSNKDHENDNVRIDYLKQNSRKEKLFDSSKLLLIRLPLKQSNIHF